MAKNSHKVKQFQKLLAKRKEQDIDAQISEAEQIVHTIKKIDSKKAFMQVQNRLQKFTDNKRFLNILIRVAAILFIPLLVTSIWLFYSKNVQFTTEQFATQKISNPAGVRSEIVLPDGSRVWLNAESKISYKVPFNSKSRNIKLSGEAFFDVKKDKYKPFRVESENVNITVMGTRFNCKAFPEDKVIEVVLAEGKVKLNSTGSKTGKEVILNSGEIAFVDKTTNKINISTGNLEKYIGWREGKLIFEECPLEEVARQLERWFGIEVKIADPEILASQISTTFENESLHQILTLLELASPVKTKLIPATFEKATQTKSKERVIINSKK